MGRRHRQTHRLVVRSGARRHGPGLQALALPDPKARKLRSSTGDRPTVQTLTGFHEKVHFQPNPLSEFEQAAHAPLFCVAAVLAGGAAP